MAKAVKLIKKKIDIFNNEEIEYWCKELDCEKKELIDAVLAGDRTVKEVKEFLRKAK